MLFHVINERGLEEIRDFLGRRHKLGRDHFDDEMIRAWASDAEFQLCEGNPPMIEIRSFDTVSGHTETYTISDAGIESRAFEIDSEDA